MYDKPSSIHIVENEERLILERRWFNLSSLGVIIFAVVWNIFLILYARQSMQTAADPEEMFLLIPLGIVGVIVAYLAVASALNRTRITVDPQMLTVSHTPLPWRSKAVERDAIQQIVVNRYNSGGTQNQRRTTYAILAQLRDGKQKRLVGDMPNSAEALYIKKALHQYLSIDAPLAAGEYQF